MALKKTLIASVNGNELYRIEEPCRLGKHWYKLAGGDEGFIDHELNDDEAELIVNFRDDYSR